MKTVTLKLVESSVIQALWWNPKTKVLHVLFLSGSYYLYFNVNRYRYYKFRHAERKGQYFNKYIKNKYTYRRAR